MVNEHGTYCSGAINLLKINISIHAEATAVLFQEATPYYPAAMITGERAISKTLLSLSTSSPEIV